MKILITGGAGFIGSHLSSSLVRTGHQVVALDDLTTGRVDNIAHLMSNPNFRFVEGDIQDEVLVDQSMSGVDMVVHLAARLGLKMIVDHPMDSMRVNATGTEVVLDFAASYRVPAVVASTSEVYGSSQKIPSAETDPICFGSPTVARWSYACAKAYDEFYALGLHREHGVPMVVTRFFNTVGARQTGRYGMVIPRLVTQALAGKPLTVYGDGSQTRSFCSVDDVVRGLCTIVGRIDQLGGEVFNLGSEREITIRELAERVIELTGSRAGITYVPYDEAYPQGFEEIMRRVPDISKARRMLGFDPKTDLDAILGSVIAGIKQMELAV